MVGKTADTRAQTATDGVRAVSVVSTGHVEIHPQHSHGSKTPLYWWLLTSMEWEQPRPINSYVIEHSKGLVLFDTGQDRASVTDDSYFPGGFTGLVYERLARFNIREEETLTARLGSLGYSPRDVDTAIVSHLHQDHIGGLPELSGANILVSDLEWKEMTRPAAEIRGFLREHINLDGLKWQRVTPEPTDDETLWPFDQCVDVMGDGSLLLLPTPGHTSGSMSLLVRRKGRAPLLLVGDLTYDADLLEQRRVPGVGQRRRLQEMTDKVLALKEAMPDLVFLPAHDRAAAERLLKS